MKTLIMLAVVCCSSLLMAQETDKGLLGDFDGNGTKEYAFAKVSDCGEECEGKCETTVYFSDKKMKSFVVATAKGGALYNLEDLNNDGRDELGFYPNWCTSCWHSFYAYTLDKGGWKHLLPPISTHCAQWEEEKFPIVKDPKKKGYVIITSSKFEDDDIKISSKSVKL
ncbi:hypothetical protein [Chryseobacterium pennipullorum]|uniref:VCBS repeat-containing protein n=1 Tax=Chryseobacterium pennipullorum TaxID=2258963 RepID=A0A3D9AYX9_9FLAO|nr:hypothetical protein [Chryseobacterium pennipullorum]REC46419.1 hypothetical protein DRF67_14155 [Chryseobacterium pennipullorum]